MEFGRTRHPAARQSQRCQQPFRAPYQRQGEAPARHVHPANSIAELLQDPLVDPRTMERADLATDLRVQGDVTLVTEGRAQLSAPVLEVSETNQEAVRVLPVVPQPTTIWHRPAEDGRIPARSTTRARRRSWRTSRRGARIFARAAREPMPSRRSPGALNAGRCCQRN